MEKVRAVRKDTRLPDDELGDLMRTVMFMIKRIDAPDGHPGKLDRVKVKAGLQEIIFETGRVVDWSRQYHDVHIMRFNDSDEHIHFLRGKYELLLQEKDVDDQTAEGLFAQAVNAHEILRLGRIGKLVDSYEIKVISLRPTDIDLKDKSLKVKMTDVIKRAIDYGLEPLSPREAPQALLWEHDSNFEERTTVLMAATRPILVSDSHTSVFVVADNGKANYKRSADFFFDTRKFKYVLLAPMQVGDFMVRTDQRLLFKKRNLR